MIAPLSFKQHRKSLIKNSEKREQGRYVVVFNCQSVSKKVAKKLFPKNMSLCGGLTFGGLEKLSKC
ncbi:hypothetical protein D0A37_05595 [Microcoleus vaginatus HSN003]|nr:hypothetical protein D0A37_05595 [Microcoleus vaginatus HSN003]